MVNANQLINGIARYVDQEIIDKLPTMGKWIVGAGVGVVSERVNNVVIELQSNSVMKALNVVDDDGYIDIDILANKLKESAEKYGKVTIDVPLMGSITFSYADIDKLRDYIVRA